MIWVAGSRILRLCCPILGLCWSILGLCWPTLVLCWPVLGPRLADHKAYVDPCWAKRSEKWDQQKNTVKRRICWWSAAHLGAMLAHLGGYVAPSWGYVGPSWSYVGPSWGYASPSWGLCWPILRLCWPILRPMLAHVDPSWATCAMLVQKHVECHRAKKHCKLQGFCRHAHPTGGRRQGPNYVDPSVGLCWPILRAMWAQLGAMLTQLGAMLAYLEGYVGRSWGLCRPILRPMLAHVDPRGAKRSEKWEQQKNTVKRRIFWGSAADLGAMLAHLGAMLAMLAHLGAMLAHLGAMLAHLGAMLAHLETYVGPSWGLSWPMLTHLKPQDPKNGKKWEEHKTP